MESKMKLSLSSNTNINNTFMKFESDNNIKLSSQKINNDKNPIFETLNNLNVINLIFNNKNKAFEALESLILNDNENNIKIKRHKYKSKSNKNIYNRERNKTAGKLLKIEDIPVPKLDFTKIYNKYNNKKLKIRKISLTSDDEKNTKKMDKIDKPNIHHHHKHHHNKKKLDKN